MNLSSWKDVPGMFDEDDARTLQAAVRAAPRGSAHVELGAWCGRSMAAAAEVLPDGVRLFSYDNYLPDSQAAGGAGKTPAEAKAYRELVCAHYRSLEKSVYGIECESAEGGRQFYDRERMGVHSLLIDDHHTAEQVEANLTAWGPHLLPRAIVLLHDYRHPPYRIAETAERMLPGMGFRFIGQVGGLGIWERP